MFRKKPDVKPFSNLKASERRRLLTAACEGFSLDESTLPADIKARILAKDIRSAKIQVHSGEKATLYTDPKGRPVWVKLDGGHLVPTLYTAWEAPFLLPRVYTVEYTLERLQNGADLMIPGIFDPLPERAPAGSIVGICLLSSPTVPVAIGVTLVDCSLGRLDTSTKGKAVEIINVLDDKLFSSYELGRIPVPTQLDVSVPVVSTQEEALEDKIAALQIADEDTHESTSAPSSVDVPATRDSEVTTNQAPEEAEEDNSIEITVDIVDDVFKRALLQVLRKAIDNPIELPMPASTFLSNHVLLNLPFNHPNIIMKRTSWKKAAKFFKTMEREKLLKCRERNGEIIILSLAGKDVDEVKNFVTFKPRPFAAHQPTKPTSHDSSTQQMTARQYFKPRSMCAPIFEESGLSPSDYYTSDGLKHALTAYINKHGLADPSSPKIVRLDSVLIKAFGVQKTTEKVGRDKVVSLLQGNCSPFHTITLPGESEPAKSKGLIPSVSMASEKRAGRKIVTKIANLEGFHIDPKKFAEELRVACAGSTSVTPIREGSDLQEVMIQGNHIPAITKLLESKGIRGTWISTKWTLGA